jgi:hypothetical protein
MRSRVGGSATRHVNSIGELPVLLTQDLSDLYATGTADTTLRPYSEWSRATVPDPRETESYN